MEPGRSWREPGIPRAKLGQGPRCPIPGELGDGLGDGEKVKLEAIRREFNYKVEALISRIDEVVEGLETDLALRSSQSDQAQAESAKRLTILAAIFLPLSLASSLLSMSSRVTELGAPWYDYFGISTSLVFLMALVYVGMRGWDHYVDKPDYLPLPMVSFIMESLKFLYSLMPFLDMDGVRGILLFCFFSAVVASFWIGIIQDVRVLGFKGSWLCCRRVRSLSFSPFIFALSAHCMRWNSDCIVNSWINSDFGKMQL